MGDKTNSLALIIPIILATISAIWAVVVYNQQQKLNRVQNLISVFQRFYINDDFVELFNLCDAINDERIKDSDTQKELLKELERFSSKKKYKYLSLLEEVAVLAKNDAVIRQNALHMFGFHFYYVYDDNKISAAFWSNVGNGVSEKEGKGWSYQYEFAKKCIASINE